MTILKYHILKKAVTYFLRRKKIYYITGMRRSGNHAFVRWLNNALEERSVKLIQHTDYLHLNYSETGKTVFLNEVNMMTGKKYLEMLWKNRRLLNNCRYLIISTEDCSSNYKSWKIPKYDVAIYVTRTILNVVASRIRALQTKAEKGIGVQRLNVTDTFFKNRWSRKRKPAGFHVWKYDEWMTSGQYRSDFLHALGLTVDIMPSISSEGGGSSFTGLKRVPNPEEVVNRFKQVKFSEPILTLLTKNKEMLTRHELEYLAHKYSFYHQSVGVKIG